MSYPWEEIRVPAGSYIGWGNHPNCVGQYAMGVVISYDPTGGTTQKGEVCPETTLELVEPAASFDKQNARTDYLAGALVQITHSQVSSKKAALAADAKPGDLIKYTMTEYLIGQGKESGDVKVFGVNIVRGYRPVNRAPVQQLGAPPQFGGQQPQQAPPNFGAPQQQSFGTTQAGPGGGNAPSFAPQQGFAGPQHQPQQQFAQNGPPPQQAPPQFGSPAYPLPPEPPQFGNGAPAMAQPASAAPSFGDDPPPF